jgi:hypothetical protein
MPKCHRTGSSRVLASALVGVAFSLAAVGAPSAQQAKRPEQANVVARIGDREITLEEVEAKLKVLPDSVRQKVMSGDNLNAYLKGMVVKELYAREAERLGLDKDPKVREQLEESRRNVLHGALVGKALGDLSVTEAEMTAFFEAHKKEYGGKAYPEVRTAVAQRLREQKARDILEKLERDAAARWPVTTNEALLKNISISKTQSKQDVEKAIQEAERRVGPLPEETKKKLREATPTVVTPTPAR